MVEKKNNEDATSPEPPPNEKELDELRSCILNLPALKLLADDETRTKILFGDIKWPTEFDKFIVQETDNTDVYVKSQIAWLAEASAYIGRHLERWAEEKIVDEIADWYKQVVNPFTYRTISIQKPCKEVEDILAVRLPALREDFKAGYEKMIAVAKQCDIDRHRWFGLVPITLINNFQLAAIEFHQIVVRIHSEALVALKQTNETAGDAKKWAWFWKLYEATMKAFFGAIFDKQNPS